MLCNKLSEEFVFYGSLKKRWQNESDILIGDFIEAPKFMPVTENLKANAKNLLQSGCHSCDLHLATFHGSHFVSELNTGQSALLQACPPGLKPEGPSHS